MLNSASWQNFGGTSRTFCNMIDSCKIDMNIQAQSIAQPISICLHTTNAILLSIFVWMLLKWSDEQDQQLARIIRKHGTGDWALVRKHFKSNRSRDSVIKRWHGKLKFQRRVEVQPPEKTKKITNDRRREVPNKRPQPAKKTNPEPPKKQVNKNPPTPAPTPKQRSHRLRNNVEVAKPARNKKSPENSEQKMDTEELRINDQHSGEEVQYTLEWTKGEDQKLLAMVLKDGVTSWQKIGTVLGCSDKEAKCRWRRTIYSMIKLDDKVGGFLKYSAEEDSILTIGYRNGLNWNELMAFLPGRSEFSIEARWRRLLRPQLQIELSKNKHYIMREFLKKIIDKKRSQRQMVEEPPQPQPQGKPS